MPIIAPCYEILLASTGGGQPQLNVMHYAKPVGEYPSPSAICDRVYAAIADTMSVRGVISAGTVFTSVTVTDIRTLEGGAASRAIGLGPLDGLGSPATAAACAVAIYRTGTRGRAARGRTFWGPIPSSYVASDGRSLLNPEAIRLRLQKFVDLMDDPIGGTGGLAVLSKATALLPAVVRQVDTVGLATVVGSQRRRMRA